MSSATSAPLIGAVLADRYEIVRHIATGGMGDVFEAHDRVLERAVAVKLYRAAAPADRSRFRSEVTTLASLNHPNLVHVFDAGEHEDGGFVVLELVEGPTLQSVMADRGALPSPEVAQLGAALASALASVHERGVVHRDVTPSNVLCGPDGRPRLTDFGIARLLDTSRITAPGRTIGTAAYMAPEQVEGRDVTPEADVYALALVLLEALTGRREYPGPASEAAMARLTRPPDVTTGVPAEWQPILAAMTAREPQRRPSASAVAERLAAGSAPEGSEGSGVSGAPARTLGAAAEAVTPDGRYATAVMPAAMARTAPPAGRRRDRRAWWLLAGVVGLLLGIVAVTAVRGRDVEDRAPSTTAPVVATSTTLVPSATSTTVVTTTTTALPPAAPVAGDEGDADEGEGRGDSVDNDNDDDNGKGKNKSRG